MLVGVIAVQALTLILMANWALTVHWALNLVPTFGFLMPSLLREYIHSWFSCCPSPISSSSHLQLAL